MGVPVRACRRREAVALGPPRHSTVVVLAFPVGKPRAPSRGFWLAVVTFTLYRFYWDVKVHDELYKQFELARERRDQGLVWYVFGFVIPLFRFFYYGIFLGNMRYLRERFGIQKGLSPGAFLGLTITASVLVYVGVFVGLVVTMSGFSEGPGETVVTDSALVGLGLGIVAFCLIAYVALVVPAYVMLQRDINALWAAYQWRAGQLGGGAPAGSQGPPSGAPPAPQPYGAPRFPSTGGPPATPGGRY